MIALVTLTIQQVSIQSFNITPGDWWTVVITTTLNVVIPFFCALTAEDGWLSRRLVA